ncbi:MAG: ABC transporter ATP-binding protein [Candidatus Omnitrophica bacterium]|nr:ABC transporter ATP-binding protein [Candidatus Omnitrophota bacterium]MDD5310381.1 ABC transporter ATP-binding protein [Candidatus Omnitrophota bacterium]MDD5545926.1 ABC transporter ATP-binding protein [Candidatus Omnitrophota bacterium]
MNEPLLEIKNLYVNFRQGGKTIEAVRGADLKVYEGEILGLVGESGSGKSVTALSVTRLLPESAEIKKGEILFDGREIFKLSEEQLRIIRGAKVSYVFQDPATSLNPVFTIGDQLIETIRLHQRSKENEAFDTAVGLLKDVGMPSPKEVMFSYPHQLSGGMKQRVMIAMAISCRPKLLIADEPTTALDVTIQAQILELLEKLREDLKLTVLLITHDLSIVAQVAEKTAVMQEGKIVEYGDTDMIYKKPSHPYTKKLIDCIPKMSRR